MVLDCLKPQRLAQFWAQALGYHPAPSSGPYVVLVPGAQPGPDLVLQRVPEPKAGKNRMHLDLRVPTLEPELARLPPNAISHSHPVTEGSVPGGHGGPPAHHQRRRRGRMNLARMKPQNRSGKTGKNPRW